MSLENINSYNFNIDDFILLDDIKSTSLVYKVVFDSQVLLFKDYCFLTKIDENDKTSKYNEFRVLREVVNALIAHKKDIGIDEIVYPEAFLDLYDLDLRGPIFSFIEGKSFDDYLQNSNDSLEQLYYFSQIGLVIDKMKKFRKREKQSFFLGDIHEGNFMIEQNSGRLRVIDIENCKLGNSYSTASMYLDKENEVGLFPRKYRFERDNILASENSDLFCYNIMLLCYIFQCKIIDLSKEELDKFIDYLEQLYFPKELIQSFRLLYTKHNNINPFETLSEISEEQLMMARVKI